MVDPESCIVDGCGVKGILNCGPLFAIGRIHKIPGTERFALPLIPHLPLCNEHVGMTKFQLMDFAKRRMKALKEMRDAA